MTSPVATRLGLAAQPESRSDYWNGVAILTLVAILALFVGLSFGPGQDLGVIFFFLLMPPGMWFLMGPWIIRHYANRLLDLSWPTALAPVAYTITSLTILAGPVYLLAALPLGLPLGDELGGAILPLLLGWAAASLAWLAFTIVIGCPPGNKAKAPELVAAQVGASSPSGRGGPSAARRWWSGPRPFQESSLAPSTIARGDGPPSPKGKEKRP